MKTDMEPELLNMDARDAEARKARTDIRARFSQGTDGQRAAVLAARMGHGVDVIVKQCGEAMMLVLGRPDSRARPPTKVPNGSIMDRAESLARIEREVGIMDRAEAIAKAEAIAIAKARKHFAKAQQIIGKISP